MESNSLQQRWRDSQTTLNGWLTIPNGWTAELMAHAGCDSLTIDAQHGVGMDMTAILTMLQAISTTDTVPLVRVGWNDPAQHMYMLDAGAQGIICPMLDTRAETEAFVRACHYPPLGIRSFGPLRAALRRGPDYHQTSRSEIITLAMIETAEGYRNLEDIAQTPHLTGLYVGCWDLSLSMGLEKTADFNDPELLGMLQNVLDVARENGLVAGVHCDTPETAVRMREMGFDMVTPLTDTNLLQKAAATGVRRFREGT